MSTIYALLIIYTTGAMNTDLRFTDLALCETAAKRVAVSSRPPGDHVEVALCIQVSR